MSVNIKITDFQAWHDEYATGSGSGSGSGSGELAKNRNTKKPGEGEMSDIMGDCVVYMQQSENNLWVEFYVIDGYLVGMNPMVMFNNGTPGSLFVDLVAYADKNHMLKPGLSLDFITDKDDEWIYENINDIFDFQPDIRFKFQPFDSFDWNTPSGYPIMYANNWDPEGPVACYAIQDEVPEFFGVSNNPGEPNLA